MFRETAKYNAVQSGNILTHKKALKTDQCYTRNIYTLCSKKKHVTTFLMISWNRTVRLQRFLAHLLL